MTEKEMSKEVEQQLFAGKSYQEVFDEFNARFPRREMDIARLIASFVSNTQRQRFGIFNIAMIILVTIQVGLRCWTAGILALNGETFGAVLTFVFSGLYVYLLIGVVRWDIRVYRFIGGLSILSLFSVFQVDNGVKIVFDPYLLLPMALIGLGFYLHSQLGGKFATQSEQYKDAQGQIRARHKIRFKN